MTPPGTCGTCACYDLKAQHPGDGLPYSSCHRFPPPEDTTNSAFDRGEAAFPLVFAKDGCWEYRPTKPDDT